VCSSISALKTFVQKHSIKTKYVKVRWIKMSIIVIFTVCFVISIKQEKVTILRFLEYVFHLYIRFSQLSDRTPENETSSLQSYKNVLNCFYSKMFYSHQSKENTKIIKIHVFITTKTLKGAFWFSLYAQKATKHLWDSTYYTHTSLCQRKTFCWQHLQS